MQSFTLLSPDVCCTADRLQKIANVVLLLITVGTIYNHSALRHPVETMFPALAALLLLASRYLMHNRLTRAPTRKTRTQPSESNGDAGRGDAKTD